jgi:hypothetical protein
LTILDQSENAHVRFSADVASTEQVYVFGRDRRVWDQPWLSEMVVGGLESDGLPRSAATVLRARWSSYMPLADVNQLADRIRSDATLEPEIRTVLLAATARLAEIAEFNRNCYLRKSPDRTRVISWPNNTKLKFQDPSHYFDIFTDLPYRDTSRFITPSTPIGSAGSCFAVRIAHQLQAWGYNYVIEEDDLPPDFAAVNLVDSTYRSASARVGTLFNVPSMRQMVERAFGLWDPEKILADAGGRLLDPYRSVSPTYRDREGFLKDFASHNAALKRALERCDAFILTLGLTEAWRFAHSGEYTSVSPWQVEPSVLRCHDLTVSENVAELERLFDVYRRFKPDIKLIISVSPVPLNKTFSTRHHVVAANALSKATLRVAAEEFCNNHEGGVFYFPSYEVVTYGTRTPWEEDMRHVSPMAVDRVMKLFRTMFLSDQTSSLPTLLPKEAVYRPSLMARAKGIAKQAVNSLGLR